MDDHGWWLVNVEFQPSGWERGSYLNVGVQWLWHPCGGFCFDYGHRVRLEQRGDFIPFETPEQFAAESHHLALLAADTVATYRARCLDLARLTTLLSREDATAYAKHIGVAYGLLGRTREAGTFLQRALIPRPDQDWHREHNRHIATLVALVGDRTSFRQHVGGIVASQRRALGLSDRRSADEFFPPAEMES